MIIDCHTHLGRNEHINCNVDQLLKSMDEARIDQSLVFAGDINDCSNEWMLEQIAPHKDRLLGVVAYTPPGFGNHYGLEYAREVFAAPYKAGEIAAVKFYTGYHHYEPSQIGWILAALNEVGCPAIFHMGDCLNSVKYSKLKYAQPLLIDDVANEYTNMNFIIAHMAYPWVREAAEVCYKNSNVYSDVSGFVYNKFTGHDRVRFKKNVDEFLDIADSDKLLFGTDFPIASQSSYLDALQYLSDGTINRQAAEIYTPEYMTKNIKRAFKLK
jgi:predicted TIM-barrel fold metal-dependent hydrolase